MLVVYFYPLLLVTINRIPVMVAIYGEQFCTSSAVCGITLPHLGVNLTYLYFLNYVFPSLPPTGGVVSGQTSSYKVESEIP